MCHKHKVFYTYCFYALTRHAECIEQIHPVSLYKKKLRVIRLNFKTNGRRVKNDRMRYKEYNMSTKKG